MESLIVRLFTQQHVQANSKENTNAPHGFALSGDFTSDETGEFTSQRDSNADAFLPWLHHEIITISLYFHTQNSKSRPNENIYIEFGAYACGVHVFIYQLFDNSYDLHKWVTCNTWVSIQTTWPLPAHFESFPSSKVNDKQVHECKGIYTELVRNTFFSKEFDMGRVKSPVFSWDHSLDCETLCSMALRLDISLSLSRR